MPRRTASAAVRRPMSLLISLLTNDQHSARPAPLDPSALAQSLEAKSLRKTPQKRASDSDKRILGRTQWWKKAPMSKSDWP